jgi:hypothetical protein
MNGLADYLKSHQADYVAAKYLEVMKAAIAKMPHQVWAQRQAQHQVLK